MLTILTLTLLLSPAQQGALDLGDPRKRGGARDLFADDEEEEPGAPETREFSLRTQNIIAVGPLALTPGGRYGAYVLERSTSPRFEIVIIDTAAATVRALGPRLTDRPQGLALGDRWLAFSQPGRLEVYAWFASENAKQAFAHRLSSPSIVTNLGTSMAEQIVISEKGALAAVLLRNAEGFQLGVLALDSRDANRQPAPTLRRVKIPVELASVDSASGDSASGDSAARCVDIGFLAQGLILAAACIDSKGPAVFRIILSAETGTAVQARKIVLEAPTPHATLTAFAPLGSLNLTGWKANGKGGVAVHDAKGIITKTISLDAPVRTLVTHKDRVVTALEDGSVWLLGLGRGANKLGLQSPDLAAYGSRQARPQISADASTVLISAHADAVGGQALLWVVPALN